MITKRRVYLHLPLALYSIFILVFSIRPVPEELPDLPDIDKLYHFAAYFILGLLWARSLLSLSVAENGRGRRRKVIIIAATVASMFGILIEVIQYFVPERSADVIDALANWAGALSGSLVYSYISARFPRKEGERAV
jgi:VanZ family protein